MIWNPDPKIEEARRQYGWRQFHRACGQQNFYIDHIERKGRQYSATAFALQDRFRAPYIMIPRSEGFGKTVIDACVDAYRKAVAEGHVSDERLELLFEDDDDLIGDVPAETAAVEDEEDLIG